MCKFIEQSQKTRGTHRKLMKYTYLKCLFISNIASGQLCLLFINWFNLILIMTPGILKCGSQQCPNNRLHLHNNDSGGNFISNLVISKGKLKKGFGGNYLFSFDTFFVHFPSNFTVWVWLYLDPGIEYWFNCSIHSWKKVKELLTVPENEKF